MKYYVIVIQRNIDGTESKGIFDYNNIDDATIAYHSNCGSNRTSAKEGSLSYYLVKIENEYGNTELMERWVKPEEPEPEPVEPEEG